MKPQYYLKIGDIKLDWMGTKEELDKLAESLIGKIRIEVMGGFEIADVFIGRVK